MNVELNKKYKLCSHTIIKAIFEEGKTIKQYPLRSIALAIEPDSTKAAFQLVISVPKRNFKKAHDRNRIRRQLKEAFRLNKGILEEKLIEQKQQIALFLVYTERTQLEYKVLESKMKKLIQQITIEQGHA
ncbi:MAG: ribonuclease P protein component [Crocinitomicaceae bacterium]|jgi:ribonuclease P protein component|nr:ribonuclease P protein component [Crocinitomicaceae bacterium]MDP4866475.1 ribonuclease P protein component [Crocinitomicaceae bacterium]MDP5010968.1 ribonuclease P protein component [Crocinitomicaceae bacterium]